MGYYTKLKFSAQLSKDAPFDILKLLAEDKMWEHITGNKEPMAYLVIETPSLPIEHEFSKTHRWNQMLNSSTMKLNIERRTLKVECEIKAYESDYIKFVDWLKPYIISGKAKSKGEDNDFWLDLLVLTKNN